MPRKKKNVPDSTTKDWFYDIYEIKRVWKEVQWNEVFGADAEEKIV